MIPEKTEYDDYRLVFKSSQEHLVEIMKAKLRADGIHVFTINKRDSSYNAFGEIEIYVKADDVVRAKYLIGHTNE
jgi:hypothetical protein